MDREQAALESFLKAFAWILLGTAVLPFNFYGDDPVWPWEGLLDATLADAVALWLPGLGSALYFLLAWARLGKVAKAAAVLAALALAWLTAGWTAQLPHALEVYQHVGAGLPPLFSRALAILLFGTVLIAAGIRLGAQGFLGPDQGRPALADPWKLSRMITVAGIVLVILFFLLPWRGQTPLASLTEGFGARFARSQGMAGLGWMAGQVLSLGPLFFALGAVVHLRRRAAESGGLLVGMSLAFVAGVCLLMGLRAFSAFPAYSLVLVRSSALILTAMVGAAVALPALIRGLWFEIPWAFGRLGELDRGLVVALSGPEPQVRLARFVTSLHPLVRPFVRRRVRLWKSMAGVVCNSADEDLLEVHGLLEQRWREEVEGGTMAAPAAIVLKGKNVPAWMTGHWIDLSLGLAMLFGTVLIALATWRNAPGPVWRAGEDEPVLNRVFCEEIPAVVSEMSVRSGETDPSPSLAALSSSLALTEARCPGLRAAAIELLMLGESGRYHLHRIRRARDRLNRLLQREGIPYFVRGRVHARAAGGSDLFYLLTYHVLQNRLYRQQGNQRVFSVLLLSRADNLNIVEPYLGATEGEEAFVTIFIDRLDEFINRALLPMAGRKDSIGDEVRRAAQSVGGALQSLSSGVDGPVGEYLLEGVIRHELHHRWLGLNPDPPAELWRWMEEYSDDAVQSVAAEVGAFLGELNFRPVYARMRIALMLDNLSEEAGYGGSHGMATRFLLKKLFLLDLDGMRNWKAIGEELVLGPLSQWSDAELQSRIEACHEELFRVAVPQFEPIVDVN